MSNALAIATVTAGLAQIIRTAIQSVLPGADVLTERPGSTPLEVPRVRLFLYQVTPNTALRNHDLATRSGDGAVMKRPTAALDLHYLLAFYGNEIELEPQRMLGAAMRDIHAKPVLMRQMVEDAIASTPSLIGSNLAEAGEQVKFTPLALSLEELSKLWSVFFQAPYALSVAYQGTVVQIESEQNVQPVLPVLRRGQDDQGVTIRLGPFPMIHLIEIGVPGDAQRRSNRPSYPSAGLGDVLRIVGRNLDGEAVRVRFEHPRLALMRVLAVPHEDRSAEEINVTLPDTPEGQSQWAAGLWTVMVILSSHGSEQTTNQLPLSLACKLTSISPPNPVARNAQGNVTLTITTSPQVRSTQSAILYCGDRELAAEAHGADTDTLRFVMQSASPMVDQLVRLRVDGVDSLPVVRRELPHPPHLALDDSQKVTIS